MKTTGLLALLMGVGSFAFAQKQVDLGKKEVKKVPAVTVVGLGATPEVMRKANAPGAKEVAVDRPSEECNRSSAEWPGQPISIGVLDFRYPTEREESHAVGNTGGGSGTALADLVFARLDQVEEFNLSRGDRRRLYRGDFAGAARLGRQMGVDAVLAGTFEPIGADGKSVAEGGSAKGYELRAGLVDTCTGQLLMRMSSASCPGGADLGGTQTGCKRYSVTVEQATDPEKEAAEFRNPVDALIFPLAHNGPVVAPDAGSYLVTAVAKDQISLKGAGVKVGDVLAVHATRLAKNPTTYTLHKLQDEEIGRVTVKSVAGGVAVGTFVGDFAVRVGDVGVMVTE